MINIENNRLRISFNRETGAIRQIYDKNKKIEYLDDNQQTDPFRIELISETISSFSEFSYINNVVGDGNQNYTFTWALSEMELTATIELTDQSEEITFNCAITNQSNNSIISLEYPIIPNIDQITQNGEDDYFIHSFATGVKVHNPIANFNEQSNGFRYMPYPEGFSGATMQFFSYYGQDYGGLHFATYDSESYNKWLNFYKNENQLLEASFIHGCEDIGPQKGVVVRYPIVIQLLEGHNWYESADIYKAWAINQYWCRKGAMTEHDHQEKSTWLLEDVGLATFGINAGYDRSKWIYKLHEYIDGKFFHILGPDWAQTTQGFGNGVPGGIDDWFPTRFSQKTLKAIKNTGDKYAPFEFDYLYNIHGADGEKGKQALQHISDTKSIDKYKFPLICPADPYVQKFHVERDERLQEENQVDSIYYDISANNILKVCMDDSHGHTKGAGKQITQAYRHNYQQTKEAMIRKANGQYIPMGTEMMNEVFLDVIDYYQARAGAQSAAALECYNIKELIKDGEAELIPLFSYVYHEYGAVRLDGWGKLVEEIGDLFFFTVARTYLWGGLYELNYEYSPLEMIDGKENASEEHYYPFEQRGYHFSIEKAKYLSKFVKLRTGVANKYLAYGKMLRPLSFDCERVKLNWFHYNCDVNFKEYNDSGEIVVDSIIHSAWQYRNESVGYLFANVSDTEQKVKVTLNRNEIPLHKCGACMVQVNSKEESLKNHQTIEITVPKRDVAIIEVF